MNAAARCETQSFEVEGGETQPVLCPVIAAWLSSTVPSSSDPRSKITVSPLPISYPILKTHNSLEQTVITQIVILLNMLDA